MRNISFDQQTAQKAVNTIKMLAIDAIESAKSGHPGACMGMADVAWVLWSKFIRFDSSDPKWPGRDRFVLSAGHASMLMYSMLNLTGYDLSLDAIRNFRQWGSPATGHPELDVAPGVETSTGPLGQGIANAVGMAIAQKMLASRLHVGDFKPLDYHIWTLCGDGDLMEGISYEAASFAGHLGLNNLTLIYDSNAITIEGSTGVAFTEDIVTRFTAMNWDVVTVDGHDHDQIGKALAKSRESESRPSLVISRSVIGKGAPNVQGSASTHGAPLGASEVEKTKQSVGWPLSPTFFIPDEVASAFATISATAREDNVSWNRQYNVFRQANPDWATVWDSLFDGRLAYELGQRLLETALSNDGKATRIQSHAVMQACASATPRFIGGSADLAPSNKTDLKGRGDVTRDDFTGSNLHFGIREHAMGGILNGIALSGGFVPFASTFLVFSDYLKPAVRLSAMMRLPVTFVFSHDGFRIGEDGPTHQPIEQLQMLRSIPGLTVIRPSCPVEVAGAWLWALEADRGPICIITSRQDVPSFPQSRKVGLEVVKKGAWVAREGTGGIAIIATGSEVSLALQAADILTLSGMSATVVSMPCWPTSEDSGNFLLKDIIGDCPDVFTLEAAATFGWHRFTRGRGYPIGLDHFGHSAPAEILEEKYGFTPQAVADRIRLALDNAD